jgi:hypothetical protein
MDILIPPELPGPTKLIKTTLMPCPCQYAKSRREDGIVAEDEGSLIYSSMNLDPGS